MKHLGDFDTSTVVYGKFTTFRPSTGAAYTLGGTPALSVYKDASTTQSTTGVTLTADFDSVTGLNHFAIDTSADGTFYAAGSFFDVVITTGTVDSVSVVGAVVGSFTLRKTSALKPATAGRTVVVDASGLVDANTVKVGPTGSGTAQTAFDMAGRISTAVPNATAGASGGLFIAGTNAPVTVTGSGSAITLLSTGGNGSGLLIAGNGIGNGVTVAAGEFGNGVYVTGGFTSGDGVNIVCTSGDGIDISGGGTSGHGAKFARGGASGDDVNFVNSDVTIPTVTTVTNAVSANVTQISGDSTAADNAESFFDGTGFGSHVLRTTVANVTSQTIIGLASATTGVANAYKGCMVAIRDHTSPANVMFAVCTAYDEGTGDLTINPTTGATFTIATSNIVEILLPTFAEDDRTTLATAGTSSLTVDATYVDAAHTWTFPSAVQTTATRIINELIGFNGLACMDFTNVIPPEVAISTVDSATFANISGTEPTVGTTSVSTNLKKVLIPINATAATANTYTLSVTVTTTDSQQFTRKGQFTVA